MAGVGIAWASILSVPYAILAGALPPGRTGVYMGIFNFFIVIPEIVASLGLRLGDGARALRQRPPGRRGAGGEVRSC
jgi:maltose/moltooligosaccharide transporter